ncbi:MAG TPA: hypothetical protein VM166_12610 [Gemmatimonadaceae bacterium]|nr:hypothetical protein [Gemmatimonadaceae bacterium]
MPEAEEMEPMPRTAGLLFIPIDKRAFGAAIGAASAALVLAISIAAIAVGDAEMKKGLALLANYFSGYSVSIAGALVGALWAFAVGFVAGWLIAFTRNLSLAVSLFLIRSRAELGETSDFLDHI